MNIEWIRRILASPGPEQATGGRVLPSPPNDDSVVIRLSPGYCSLGGGETWHEADPGRSGDQR